MPSPDAVSEGTPSAAGYRGPSRAHGAMSRRAPVILAIGSLPYPAGRALFWRLARVGLFRYDAGMSDYTVGVDMASGPDSTAVSYWRTPGGAASGSWASDGLRKMDELLAEIGAAMDDAPVVAPSPIPPRPYMLAYIRAFHRLRYGWEPHVCRRGRVWWKR